MRCGGGVAGSQLLPGMMPMSNHGVRSSESMRIDRCPGNHWRYLILGAASICLVGLLASCGQSRVAAIATPTDTVEPTATATVAPTATVTATPKPTAVPTHTAPPP